MSSSLSTVIFSCTSNELTLQCPCNDCHMLISNTLYACIWPFWCPNDKSSKTLCHISGFLSWPKRVGTKCQSVVVVNTRNMLLTLLANVYTDFECHRQSTSSHNISHTFPIMPACVTFSLGMCRDPTSICAWPSYKRASKRLFCPRDCGLVLGITKKVCSINGIKIWCEENM